MPQSMQPSLEEAAGIGDTTAAVQSLSLSLSLSRHVKGLRPNMLAEFQNDFEPTNNKERANKKKGLTTTT